MSTSSLVRELTGKPTQPLPWSRVEIEYRGQVSAILDQVSSSKSTSIQTMVSSPQRIKWFLLWDWPDPGKLPPSVRDYEGIRGYYAANTRVFLKAIVGEGVGGKMLAFEPIHSIPAAIAPLLEQKARLLADRKSGDPEEPTDIEEPVKVVPATEEAVAWRPNSNGKLTHALTAWFNEHPKADRRLFVITHKMLSYLEEAAQ